MAHIRARATTRRRNGKPVISYAVVFRERARDSRGLPIPGKMRSRQETYYTREQAQARCDELSAAKHSVGGPSALAEQRKLAMLPYDYFAAEWLAEQNRRLSEGTLKVSTFENYERALAYYVLKRFGDIAIGSIALRDCEAFRTELASKLGTNSVRNIWHAFTAVFRYAQRANAIQVNPATLIDGARSRRSTGPADSAHRPLTAPQVAALAAQVRKQSHPVFELLVLFLCYTGLRRAEAQGLEIRDVILSTDSNGVLHGSVRVHRTKTRRKAEWVTDTPKSKASRRTVPLPDWLAERMAHYLAHTHPKSGVPDAPLWPRRLPGGARCKGERAAVQLDWSRPCDLQTLQRRVIRPALAAIGLPSGTPTGTKGVRLHDFRHTAAMLWLTADVHFMQVGKWLGHSTYVVTMTVYADYLPEVASDNPLPEPIAPSTTAGLVTANTVLEFQAHRPTDPSAASAPI